MKHLILALLLSLSLVGCGWKHGDTHPLGSALVAGAVFGAVAGQP